MTSSTNLFDPPRWLASSIKKSLSRLGYSVVRSELLAADQAELLQLRHTAQSTVPFAPSADLLELLSQPVPSPSRPADGLYTSIFSRDGLINDPKVIRKMNNQIPEHLWEKFGWVR